MKRYRAAGVLFLAIAAAAVVGCQESSTSDEPSGPTLETHQLGDLPALAEPLPTLLDNDRLEVAAPKRWHIASKNSDYLTRFQVSRDRKYPTILVTVEEYAGDVFEVTAENAAEFAKQRTAAMAADASASRQQVTPTPIKVGSFAGISYRRRGSVKTRFKEIVLERLMLETVACGRLYTIELRVREGEENQFRPHLLAVAGGLKFFNPEEKGEPDQTDPDAAEPDAPDPDESPNDSPGEEEKDDPEAKPEEEGEEKPEAEGE